MKVALMLFGHLRTYESTYKSLKKNLLDLYDCDVFIHTWDELQAKTQTWYKPANKNRKLNDRDYENIKQFYHPKSFLVEKQLLVKDDVILSSFCVPGAQISYCGMLNMFYSLYQVNELRKKFQIDNNIDYDLVIVSRPDVLMKTPFYIHKYICFYSKILEDCSNVRFCCCANADSSSDLLLREIGLTDIVYFGSPGVINKISEFYLYINVNLRQLADHFTLVEGEVFKYSISRGISTILLSYTYGKDWTILRLKKNILEKIYCVFQRLVNIFKL